MSRLAIPLLDAANNCEHDGAEAILTLRSGVQFRGKLKKLPSASAIAHLKTSEGGWATVLVEEIAAVSAVRHA